MAQEANYYRLLAVSSEADLHEIAQAYRQLSRHLQAEADELAPADLDAQQTLLKTAFDVLSNPLRRADYDAGLALRAAEFGVLPPTLAVRKPRSPLRTLLTVIAALMAIGLTIQVSVMLMAYKRAKAVYGEEAGVINAPEAAAERAALQDFYQTYGIRARSRAEMELLIEDIRRQQAAERDAQQQERQQDEQARKERQFADEAHRIGQEVSDNLRRAEREIEMARAEAQRQAEDKERQAEEKERRKKEAERERIEQSLNRWRSQSPSDPE